jgi:hypothetical protein
VVDTEAAEKLGVGGEESPALGDDGGAEEIGWLRWEAEHDLVEEVVVFQRMRRYRRRRGGSGAAAAAAGHCCPRPSVLYWVRVGEREARRERGLETAIILDLETGGFYFFSFERRGFSGAKG